MWGEGTATAEQQRFFLPPSLHDCLSVSSASMPPYTLSHFSPMSLSQQGGGDMKRERETNKQKSKRGEKRREIDERKITLRMKMRRMLKGSIKSPVKIPSLAVFMYEDVLFPSLPLSLPWECFCLFATQTYLTQYM